MIFDNISAIIADATGNRKDNWKLTPVKTYDDVLNLLTTEYSQAFNRFAYDRIGIYKGFEKNLISDKANRAKVGVIITPGVRLSHEATTNTVNLLQSSILPSWKKFTPRNKSLIGSLNPYTAKTWADNYDTTLHQLFPINNTDVTIAPNNDFSNAFNYNGEEIDTHLLYYTIIDLFVKAGVAKSYHDYYNNNRFLNSPESLINALKQLETYILSEKPTNTELSTAYEDYIIELTRKHKNIIKALDIILKPKKFKIYKIADIPERYSAEDSEAWFSAKCLVLLAKDAVTIVKSFLANNE